MRKSFLFLVLLLTLISSTLRAQENAVRYLELFAKKYSGLNDYTTDVWVHFDIEAFKAPDMKAKLYYKSPDKMKAVSKGIFFFPKQGGYLNPSLFNAEDFDVKIIDHVTVSGARAVRLQLTPKDIKKGNQKFVLTIDTSRNLLLGVNTMSLDGREIKAAIEYGKFGDFDLPTRIKLNLDFPPADPNESQETIPFAQKEKRVTGKIEIAYSNYKVNSGLSDEIFIRDEPNQQN